MTGCNGHPSGTGHVLVRADEADADTLSELIADAFFPLAPCQWLIGDETARRAVLPGFFALYVEHALADGQVWTTPDRDGVALWLPAGITPPEPSAGYAERLAAVTGPWLARFEILDAEFDKHHPAGFAHHHLAVLAVRPDRQGCGIGTALLNTHHAILDQDGTPAYLEASDERNRGLYLRHGYADHGSPIRLPDGPSMYPMTRQPRAGGG